MQRIETCNPSLSGDIGGLEFFGEVDKTKPPLALDGSKVSRSSVTFSSTTIFGRTKYGIYGINYIYVNMTETDQPTDTSGHRDVKLPIIE